MIAGNVVTEVKDSSMVKEPYKSQKRHESVRCYHSDVNLPGQLTHIGNI